MADKISIFNSTLKADPDKQNAWKRRSKPINRKSKNRDSVLARLKRVKKAVIANDGCECVMCGWENEKDLELEHIWTQGSRPEWRFIRENGKLLCNFGGRNCHDRKHNDPEFKQAYFEKVNAEEIRQELMRGVGTIIE